MYTAGDLIPDFTEGKVYSREILDPEGIVICYVIESNGDESGTEALLSHLNK